MVYVVSLNSIASPNSSLLNIYLIASLIAEEALTKIPIEYTDFADMFFPDLAFKLPKHIGINNHFIELVDTNGFIRPFKSPASAFIFFDPKSDKFL